MTPDFYDFLLSPTTSARFAVPRSRCTCIMCSIARRGEMTFGATLSRSVADAMREYTAVKRLLSSPTYAKLVPTSWNTSADV